jgi:hypothetical protein
MRIHWLCTTAVALLMAGGIGFAAAQTPPAGGNPPETSTEPKKPAEQAPSAQHTQQPEATDPASSQVAPAEPKSVHMPQSSPAFVNGSLAASADKDSSTAPAKFSAKNDAEDHMPIMSFTFKNLSEERKRTIVESVKDAKTAPPQGTAPPEACRSQHEAAQFGRPARAAGRRHGEDAGDAGLGLVLTSRIADVTSR